MLERISEPIGNSVIKKATSTNITNPLEIFDFETESNIHKSKVPGTHHNFNYEINFLSVSYNLPSLAEKPFQEYPIQSEEQQRVDNIEFGRLYNEGTVNEEGKPYACKLTLFASPHPYSSGDATLTEVLLYNHGTKVTLPLIQYINTIFSPDFNLYAKFINFSIEDKIEFIGSYSGNMNYTFDSGTQEYKHLFP